MSEEREKKLLEWQKLKMEYPLNPSLCNFHLYSEKKTLWRPPTRNTIKPNMTSDPLGKQRFIFTLMIKIKKRYPNALSNYKTSWFSKENSVWYIFKYFPNICFLSNMDLLRRMPICKSRVQISTVHYNYCKDTISNEP